MTESIQFLWSFFFQTEWWYQKFVRAKFLLAVKFEYTKNWGTLNSRVFFEFVHKLLGLFDSYTQNDLTTN